MYFFVPSMHNFSSIFEETPNFWQAQYIAQYVNIFRDKLYQIVSIFVPNISTKIQISWQSWNAISK